MNVQTIQGDVPQRGASPDSRYRATCCECGKELSFRPSIAMQAGMNSGHLTCPKCHTFLHVEIAEGDRAATEKWTDYIEREKRGPAGILQVAHRSQ